MEPITVFKHGERWAVRQDPGQPPSAEYETREAAESAARHRAAEGQRVVVEDDPGPQAGGHGGGVAERGSHVADGGVEQRTGGGGSGDETPRQDQAGL